MKCVAKVLICHLPKSQQLRLNLNVFFLLARYFKFEIIFKQFMSSDSFQATFCRSSPRRIHVTISWHKSFSFSSS